MTAPEARFPSAEEVKALAAAIEFEGPTNPLDTQAVATLRSLIPLAAAAEGGESLREALRRPVIALIAEWFDAEHATPLHDRIVAALSPLISAHVAARVADAGARAYERAAQTAETSQAQHELNQPLVTQIGKNLAKAIRALAQQPAPVAEGLCDCELSHNGLGLAGRVCDCPAGKPAPVEPAPDAEDDARRERVARAIEPLLYDDDPHVRHRVASPYTVEARQAWVAQVADRVLAALPASDAAPAQGEASRWIWRNWGGAEFVHDYPLPVGYAAQGWTETPLYAHPTPARTEPSEVEAIFARVQDVIADHEGCSLHFAAVAILDAIRTRGAGGWA